MNTPVELRDAIDSDLDDMCVIEQAVFDNEAWSRQAMYSELTGSHRRYFAAIGQHGQLVGYAGVLIVGEEADIQTIALTPEARGSGSGRLLMNALLTEARAKGATQVFLEVRADNLVARGLYVSLGFEQIAVRPGYYQPANVDAIVMRLLMEKWQ